VQGRRLYRYARKGIEVERQPRTVVISAITPVVATPPDVVFDVVCSKGTYVRTLVEDVGLTLGCGAHVTALERTRIGAFRLEEAWAIDDLVRMLLMRRGQAA